MAEIHVNVSRAHLYKIYRDMNPAKFPQFTTDPLGWARSVPSRLFNRFAMPHNRRCEVVGEALTILNWAAKESQQGRVVLSSNPEGQDIARLNMRSLEMARLLAGSQCKPG